MNANRRQPYSTEVVLQCAKCEQARLNVQIHGDGRYWHGVSYLGETREQAQETATRRGIRCEPCIHSE